MTAPSLKVVGKNILRDCDFMALAPSIAFWGSGLLILLWKNGWEKEYQFLKIENMFISILLSISVLFVILVLNELVMCTSLVFLHIVEGYLPKSLNPLRKFLVNKIKKRLANDKEKWEQLAEKFDRLSSVEIQEYALLDDNIKRYPEDTDHLQPFRLGNVLSAAEDYSKERYGLDITVIWPRLWILLPNDTQKQLCDARRCLDRRVQLLTWGILYAAWGIWTLWALLAALIIASFTYKGLLEAAENYGDLIRSVFDLYRFKLYESMKWPLPNNPEEEKVLGINLTIFLFRGEHPDDFSYINSNTSISTGTPDTGTE